MSRPIRVRQSPSHRDDPTSDIVPISRSRRELAQLASAALSHARAGELPEARRAVSEAVLLLEDREPDAASAEAALALGDALLLLGVPHYAKSHFEVATTMYDRIGDPWGAARARAGVGRALLAYGDAARGEQILAVANAMLEELGE